MLQVLVLVLSILQAWGHIHSSTFLVPALYSYGNCDAVPYPQTVRIYATTQLQESKSHVILAATGKSTSHFLWLLDWNNLIDNVFEYPLLQLHQNATSRAFCLNYYCNGDPTQQGQELSQRPVCTERNSASGVYAYVNSDVTVSFLVSNKGPNFMIMYSALPISFARNASYYILNPTHYLENYVQAFALRGLKRNSTEVTIIPTAPIKVYQPALLPEVTITMVGVYDEITLTVLPYETVWVETATVDCDNHVTLTGTLIESSFEVAVFSAQALCTEEVVLPSAVNSTDTASGGGKDEKDIASNVWAFHFILNPLHQLPPVDRWGKLYIVDLKKLLLLSEEDTKSYILLFSIMSATDTQVSVTCHGQKELKVCDVSRSLGRGEIWRYELHAKTVVQVAEALVIKGDGPIMVLHEIYSQTQREAHHSELLQSVDWFLKKQAVPVAYSLDDRIRPREFAVSLVMPSSHMSTKTIMVWDNKEQVAPSLLGDYKMIKSYSHTVVEDYTVVHVLLDQNGYNQTDYIVQFVANSTDGRARFGASIFSYRGYAFSNGYVLDNNRTSRVPVQQQQYSNLPSSSLAIGSVTGVVLLVVISVLLLVLCHRKGLPLLPWLPPPPIEGFEYDVFLSFADEDKEFTERILYDPLKERGYKVLIHLTDFIAGMTIEENIIQAVNSSRVVIYVCSKNFNSSSFCQTELKYGMESHYSKYGGCYRRVVPVWIGGECPTMLSTFRIRPIKTPASVDSYNEVLVHKLLDALRLGKPIHSSGRRRNIEEVQLI